MKTFLIGGMALVLVAVVACGGNSNEKRSNMTMKAIVGHYLQIKNGLAKDNADEAANGAKAMFETLSKADKSLFTSDQKMMYDEKERNLKEHAANINKGNIVQQREHFSMMSKEIYALVRAFGGGQPLYRDHCPMANNGEGGMWLSESKEIKNPYMGSKMPSCGTVEEKLQ